MTDQGKGGLGVKVFFVWGSLCAMCSLFAFFMVPETKGLTLEQVDRMMEEVSARRSGKWRSREDWARDLSGMGEQPTSVQMQPKSSQRSSATTS